MTQGNENGRANVESLQSYYRFHSAIYDITRWAFLFGRGAILAEAAKFATPRKILEIGCGTGKNLLSLHRMFPDADLTGVDISSHMLQLAERKLLRTGASARMHEKAYSGPMAEGSFDLVLFSYCLSMINPGWEDALLAAKKDLSPDGVLAVVDFDGTNHAFFAKWMAVNHVRMERHMADFLRDHFRTRLFGRKKAYGGLWDYFLFVGAKG